MRQLSVLIPVAVALVAVSAACGSGRSAAPATTPTTTTTTTTAATTTSGAGALQGEVNATAAGDIPDNQVFLRFRNSGAGYSMKYPEGWAQQGAGGAVTFRDKNNVIRAIVSSGAAWTTGAVQADVQGLSGARLTHAPAATTLSGRPAFKVVYQTVSAPNPVTGKRVTLTVDRYYVWTQGRRAVLDLGCPVGVDNVDAYRTISESFRWS